MPNKNSIIHKNVSNTVQIGCSVRQSVHKKTNLYFKINNSLFTYDSKVKLKLLIATHLNFLYDFFFFTFMHAILARSLQTTYTIASCKTKHHATWFSLAVFTALVTTANSVKPEL